MSTEKNVLLINVHSTLNGGDLALLECAALQIEQIFGSVRLHVVSNFPFEDYYTSKDWVVLPSPWWIIQQGQSPSVFRQMFSLLGGILLSIWTAIGGKISPRSKWYELFKAYQKADVVIGVAGNQFYSTGKYGWPFPVTCMSVYLAHLFDKPFYTFPQSIGPLRRWWERVLIRALYRRAKRVYVRDVVSLELLQQLGLGTEQVKLVPDPAFAYPMGNIEEAQYILSKYGWRAGQPSIGATIISDMGRSLRIGKVQNYYDVMARVLERCVSEWGVQCFLFAQVHGPTLLEDDQKACQQLVERIRPEFRQNIAFVNEEFHPTIFKACYRQLDMFLATRLHSGIFSLGSETPTVFIGYLTKTLGVMRLLGLEQFFVQIDDLTEEILWQKVLLVWQQKDAIRLQLAQIMPKIRQQTHQTVKEIAQDWQND